jgi:hypothetical protein
VYVLAFSLGLGTHKYVSPFSVGLTHLFIVRDCARLPHRKKVSDCLNKQNN